jgi:uncharacterized protein (TIGR02246 family)
MYRSYVSGVPNSSSFVDAESQIRDLNQDFCTAFNTGNYDHVAALFAPDGILMAPHREALQDSRAIERALRDFRESGYQDLRLETIRVDHSGDMALEIGRYSVAIRQANGTTVADHGKYVRAWRRLGVWLIVAYSWNSNLPASEDTFARENQLHEANKRPIIVENVPKSA